MKTDNIRKVLIALDYNSTALKVAETGFSLAKAMNAEVIILHVISNPVYYSSPGYSSIIGLSGESVTFPPHSDNAPELKIASHHILERYKKHLGDESIRLIVTEGDFAGNIINAAKSIHADVIVMGSHSRRWLENIIMGNVTSEVLMDTTIPVFIVPTKITR